MTSILHQYILVGLETDPTRYHGEHASRPALLERAAAEQVLAHIAADLTSMFPAINRCTLSMAGALFDQTQVLQPRLPIYRALETLQKSSNPGTEFQARLLSIGVSEGQMPLQELQPFENIPLGLLQILPLLITGPAEYIDELSTEMEHRFLETGQVSAHSAKALESQFQVSVNHARFMTITDLNALLRLQLERYGFLPLWELLDAAMNPPADALEISTPGGLRFKWQDDTVHSYFESFDWWAQYGAGTEQPPGDQQLQSAYADWTREYRRYLTMLTAHGVRVCQHLPGLEDAELTNTFLLEESTHSPQPSAAGVTAHSADDLGTIAVTVVSGARQMNFYPLQANGLNDLHQFIRDQGYNADIAYPGRLCYDESSRQLIAERLPG
ncbi:MAG: hypothetical protein QNK19_07590 [Xanthomonadales bacterium]|nr:hypothetical protein [Xanthomonadales bacterium]